MAKVASRASGPHVQDAPGRSRSVPRRLAAAGAGLTDLAAAALVIIVPLLVAAIQALAGVWLARAIRPGPRPEPGTAGFDDGFRSFKIIWSGQFASLVGSAIASFALGLRIYQLTGSAVQLGAIYACGLVPAIVASPISGALADRWGRRRALLISNGGYMVTMTALALLLFTGTFTVWAV